MIEQTVFFFTLSLCRRYQVWLEVYLRNGKVFQSNVIEVTTKEHQEPIDLQGNFCQ